MCKNINYAIGSTVTEMENKLYSRIRNYLYFIVPISTVQYISGTSCPEYNYVQ